MKKKNNNVKNDSKTNADDKIQIRNTRYRVQAIFLQFNQINRVSSTESDCVNNETHHTQNHQIFGVFNSF